MKIPVKILIIDLLLFLICIPGIIQVIHKADLPFPVIGMKEGLTLKADYPPFKKNDLLISINGNPVNSIDQLEFTTDTKNKGDIVSAIVSRNGAYYESNIVLRRYYSGAYIAAASVIGLSFFVLAFLVLSNGTEKKASVVFHWGSVSTALILFCTWGNIYLLPYNLGWIVRYTFHAGYVAAPAIFIHFAYLFPIDREKERKKIIYFFYLSAALLFLYLSFTFTLAARDFNPVSLDLYLYASNLLRVYIISGVLISVIIFTKAYFLASGLAEKKKLKWILFGFFAGPLMYILAWVIPQALGFTFIPEIAAIFFMLFVPVTFAIAILKYHLFDIDFVINRSIVYSISVAFLVLLYFAIVYLVSGLLTYPGNNIPSVVSVVAAALLFQPVKRRVQRFVDLKFFRVQYDFRNAVKQFFSDLKQSNDFNALSEFVVKETDRIIPLSRSGIVLCDAANKIITHFYHKGFEALEQEGALYKLQLLFMNADVPAAFLHKLESSIDIGIIDKEMHQLFGIVIIIPLLTNEKKLGGYFIAGEKKSGSRFSIEDVEMLKLIGMRTALEISRIKLNQELIYEQLQKEKLQELDKLKSFFISSTAHELKTPLTSIKLFSETLERKLNETDNKYLQIIKGECDRLTRLIDNLLDISRIERSEKKYYPEPVFLLPLLRKSLLLMEYQFNMENCTVTFEPGKIEELLIYADEDAVISALINIYTNALKYSRAPKKLAVKVNNSGSSVVISISDNGIGMSEEDVKNILQPYYRSTLVQNKNFIGTGIGLALVKHIVEGHSGKIYINSIPGEGSTFTLEFPVLKEESAENEKRITL